MICGDAELENESLVYCVLVLFSKHVLLITK